MPDNTLTEFETCSWCTQEVRNSSLRETDDWARICRDCQRSPDAKGRLV